jgi:hypothetical protein
MPARDVSGPKNKDKHDLQSPTYRHVTNVRRIRPSQAYPSLTASATSHEVNMIAPMSDDDLRAVGDEKFVRQHRERAMSPVRPILRGTAQNPDAFFQAREACNPFYRACPTIVQDVMDRFVKQTGLFDYYGPADAERLVILMGSGAGAAEEAVDVLRKSLVEGAIVPAMCRRSVLKRNSEQREVDRGTGPHKRTGQPGRAVVSGCADRVHGTARVERGDGHSVQHWWTLRAFVKGIYAGDGQGGLRRTEKIAAKKSLHCWHPG